MFAKVNCFLPSHHEHYVEVSVDGKHIECGGYEYEIEDVDLDELEEWREGTTMDKLMVTIFVDIEHFCFEAKYYGEINDGRLCTSVEELEITEVTVPGMLCDFYDVDANNNDAEAYLIRLLESR